MSRTVFSVVFLASFLAQSLAVAATSSPLPMGVSCPTVVPVVGGDSGFTVVVYYPGEVGVSDVSVYVIDTGSGEVIGRGLEAAITSRAKTVISGAGVEYRLYRINAGSATEVMVYAELHLVNGSTASSACIVRLVPLDVLSSMLSSSMTGPLVDALRSNVSDIVEKVVSGEVRAASASLAESITSEIARVDSKISEVGERLASHDEMAREKLEAVQSAVEAANSSIQRAAAEITSNTVVFTAVNELLAILAAAATAAALLALIPVSSAERVKVWMVAVFAIGLVAGLFVGVMLASKLGITLPFLE